MRALLISALCAAPAAAQEPAPGFALEALPYPGQSVVATLASGETIAWDGLTVARHAPDGALLLVLASAPSFVYPSFVEVDPTETFAVVGESSSGVLRRVDLAGGGASTIATVPFNFDAVLDARGDLLVSAALGGLSTGNDLLKVDLETGAIAALAHVAGASGPIALDGLGNLYYATQDSGFPAQPGSTDLLVFLAPALAGGVVLDESDALLVAQGFDGASSLAYDRERGVLYLAETNFGTGLNRILHVNGGPATSIELLAGPTSSWISGLEVRTAPGGAQLAPFQPAHGGSLYHVTTDFAGSAARRALVPRRPELELEGPGLSGPGAFDVALAAGPPGGLAMLAFGPQAALLARELSVLLGGPPILIGLDPSALFVAPLLLALDAQGGAVFHATNPGGLEHALAIQGLLLHPGGFPAGTTAAIPN